MSMATGTHLGMAPLTMPASAGSDRSPRWSSLRFCSKIAFGPHCADTRERNAHGITYTSIRTYPKHRRVKWTIVGLYGVSKHTMRDVRDAPKKETQMRITVLALCTVIVGILLMFEAQAQQSVRECVTAAMNSTTYEEHACVEVHARVGGPGWSGKTKRASNRNCVVPAEGFFRCWSRQRKEKSDALRVDAVRIV